MTKTPQLPALAGMTPLGLKQPALGASDKPEAFDQVTPNKLSAHLPNALPGLGHFIGTEQYWKYALMPKFTYTDGVRHIAQEAGAYWLLDVIFSHVMEIYRSQAIDDDNKRLLVCKLRRHSYEGMHDQVKGNGARFTIEDGNYNTLATQEIEFTDFPAMTCDVWVQNGVALLPSEY